MYELIQAGKSTYYINCPAKMGLYVDEAGGAYLIDSGNDKDAGRKADKHLKEQGWTLKMIINTHSNADHIGGNKILADRYDCPIYAKGIEAAFTEYPLLEPSFLFGGYPMKALRNKFLMAQPSGARDIMKKMLPGGAPLDFGAKENAALGGAGSKSKNGGSADLDLGAPRIIAESELADDFKALLPAGFEFVNLPGHFFDMIGVKTPDEVWFAADCVSSADIIEKYHVSFIYDVRRYLETLDFIETLDGELFVPAHTDTQENMKKLAEVNRKKAGEICELICKLCREPLCFEELLAKVFSHYGLVMDASQYVLVGSTVKSYLSYLADEGHMEAAVDDNFLKWKSI